MDDPSIAQLRALVELARTGRYDAVGSRAAGWQLLRRLEHYIMSTGGPVPLVVPGSSRITAQGMTVAEAAEDLLRAVDAFKSRVRDLTAQRLVRVACFPAHAGLVAGASTQLRASGVEIPVELIVGELARHDGGVELLDRLQRGEVDLAILPEDAVPTGDKLEVRFLYKWSLVVVGTHTHPWNAHDSIRVNDLAGLPIMVSPRGHLSRDLLDAQGQMLSIVLETDSADALVELAARGWGTAIVPDDSIPLRSLGSVGPAPHPLWTATLVGHEGRPLGGAVIATARKHSVAGPVGTLMCAIAEEAKRSR